MRPRFHSPYLSLTAATGALVLFGAVQATMITWGLRFGDRLGKWQVCGLACAYAGLIGLLLPASPHRRSSERFSCWARGVAWGVYSLRGRSAGDPTRVTAEFPRARFLRGGALAGAASSKVDRYHGNPLCRDVRRAGLGVGIRDLVLGAEALAREHGSHGCS